MLLAQSREVPLFDCRQKQSKDQINWSFESILRIIKTLKQIDFEVYIYLNR